MLRSVKLMTSFGISVGFVSNAVVGNTFCAVLTFPISTTTASLISVKTASGQLIPFDISMLLLAFLSLCVVDGKLNRSPKADFLNSQQIMQAILLYGLLAVAPVVHIPAKVKRD
jgi:hypothetical protein